MLTPFVNSFTCFSMYAKNASELHLPISMMVYTGSFARYAIIANDDCTECVPISLLVKPRISGPIISTAALRSVRISLEDIFENFLPSKYVDTSQSSLKPGYERRRRMVNIQCNVGLRLPSSEFAYCYCFVFDF